MSKWRIEIERETDGRWIAEVTDIPGCMVYGATRDEAIRSVEVLALRVIADRLDAGETVPFVEDAFLVTA
jgi:predicted RNase H-like HicB family nuclease